MTHNIPKIQAPTAWPGEKVKLIGGKKFQIPVTAVNRPVTTSMMLITRLMRAPFYQ